jgi:hypothetical protein
MGPASFDLYAILALTCILFIFYFVRTMGPFFTACTLVTLTFAAVSSRSVDWAHPSQWIVLNCGLQLCVFGLLIVRAMLVRSVSLRLLARIATGQSSSMTDDITGRVKDLRRLAVIRSVDGKNTLTHFGRVIGAAIAVLYALIRIRA